MRRTRIVFFTVIGIALAIVAAAVIAGQGGSGFSVGGAAKISGYIGSEKEPFFHDPRVQDELRKQGLDVTVLKAGSREIAGLDLSTVDFVFPAGVPAAEKILQERGPNQSYTPFFTAMVIASWRPIAELLAQQGIARDQGGYYTVDMAALVQLMATNTRWQELPGNITFPVNKSVLITSTDVRKSNSAAMYLSLASYVANGDNIVQTMREAESLLPMLADLFLRQGLRPDSSQEPFEDYLVKGMGHSPMVMIYEAQYLAQLAQAPETIQDDMVLMYPQPTIFTKHTLIPLTPGGEKLGEALETDPVLQKLAIEYGLRNSNVAEFRAFIQRLNLGLPETILDVVEPPSYEVLEGMIQRIEVAYQGGQP